MKRQNRIATKTLKNKHRKVREGVRFDEGYEVALTCFYQALKHVSD